VAVGGGAIVHVDANMVHGWSTLEGEMVVSDRQLAPAYWQGPDKRVPIPQDGFRNGDLSRQDDEGYVYITGRKKDIIIMGGVNIASLDITKLPARARRRRRRRHARGEGRDLRRGVPGGFVALRPGRSVPEAALLERGA
jgi:acyl-CoA synthetase (AMP-forming)/AMP-acid ligase II